MKRLIVLLVILCSSIAVHAEVKLRPTSWATPVIGSSLNNLYALDAKVFRSEQPDEEEFAALEQFGIKEVLNLRQYHSDDDEADQTQLKLNHVKMNAGSVTGDQIVQALKIIQNANGPILIHCWHGSDRTGIVSAAYRIVFQDWPKEQAIEELKEGGYGYHASIYPNIVETLRALDVNAIKAALGLTQ